MMNMLTEWLQEMLVAGTLGIVSWAASVELRLRKTGHRLLGDGGDPNNPGALKTLSDVDDDVERLDEKVEALDGKVDNLDEKLDETHEIVVEKLDEINGKP